MNRLSATLTPTRAAGNLPRTSELLSAEFSQPPKETFREADPCSLTYANVVSSLCLFLVLGGATAIAAGGLGKNSVGPRQLKKNAVTAAKIKEGAVNAGKLAPGAVTAGALAPGAVSAGQLAPGTVTGDKLAAGAVGAGKLGAISIQTAPAPIDTGFSGSVNAFCLPGERAISGGGSWSAFGTQINSTRPIKDEAALPMAKGEVPTGWRASGTNASGAQQTLNVWVVCIK